MPSNDPGQCRGSAIIVAFFVVVYLAFLFFGDQVGAVSNGTRMSACDMVPITTSPPSITLPPTPPEIRTTPAAPSS
jgi:hypothetical protein